MIRDPEETARLLAFEKATGEPIFSVLYDSPNDHFVGRESQINSLYSLLVETKPLRYNHRIALHGMGGVGKTELAIQYAYRHKQSYYFVYSISAESRLSIISGYVSIAQQTHCVQIPDKASPEATAKSVVQWLQKNTTKSWLLILDNLDEITDAKGLLPVGSPEHHTLITTRDDDVYGIPAEGLPVEEMDENEAIKLLLIECGPKISQDPNAAASAKIVVDMLGKLPLALHHAAAFIRSTGDISSYCSTFSESHQAMLKNKPHGNYNYERSVSAAFHLCFQDKRLRENAPSSIRLAELMAFLNADLLLEFFETGSPGLPSESASMLDSKYALAEALRGLKLFSLVKTTHGGQQISIHRLVQIIIRDNLRTEGTYELRVRECIDLCQVAFHYLSDASNPDFRVTRDGIPSWDASMRERFQLFLPQVMACLDSYEGHGFESFLKLAEEVAYFLRDEGYYDSSIQLWKKALDMRTQLIGPDHTATVASKYGLAVSLGRNGNTDAAALLLEEVYSSRTRILGPNHEDTLWSKHVLAWAYRVRRPEDAAALFTETLSSQNEVLGPEHTDTLRTKHALAIVYDRLGRREEAAQLLRETFDTQAKVLGREDPDTVRSENGLAFSLGHLKKFDEAATLFEELAVIRKNRLGPSHIDSLWTRHGLACAYASTGRFAEALSLLEEILGLQKRTLGDDHPMTLASKYCLAAVRAKLGMPHDSRDDVERLLSAIKSSGSFLVPWPLGNG